MGHVTLADAQSLTATIVNKNTHNSTDPTSDVNNTELMDFAARYQSSPAFQQVNAALAADFDAKVGNKGIGAAAEWQSELMSEIDSVTGRIQQQQAQQNLLMHQIEKCDDYDLLESARQAIQASVGEGADPIPKAHGETPLMRRLQQVIQSSLPDGKANTNDHFTEEIKQHEENMNQLMAQVDDKQTRLEDLPSPPTGMP